MVAGVTTCAMSRYCLISASGSLRVAATKAASLSRESTYAHLGGSQCTPCGVLQDRANLLKRHAREPLYKLGHQRTVFKILKQRRHRHAGTTEYPGAADALRVALHRCAGGPVNHGGMVPPRDEDGAV